MLSQLDFGKLLGGDVGTEVNLLHIRHFEKRGAGSSQFSGFGILGKDGSRQRRGDVAFAQLVFYLRHLDADRGTLPRQAPVTVAQGGVLCVELLAEDFEKGLGIIQLLLVGGTHTEQVGHTVALAPCLHNLFLSGGYLLQDIRPLAFHGLDTGLQLEFLQIELDGIYNAYLLPVFQCRAFLDVETQQFSRRLGRNDDFGSLERSRRIIFRSTAGTGGKEK